MRRAHPSLAAAFAAVTALAAPARAGGSAADREAARGLAGKGYDELEARRFRHAIELFQQAEGHFHAPTHLLYIARAQVKLGLLVEARATFERVLAEKLAADAPGPYREAQTSARAELAEVVALLPSLVISFRDPPAGVQVILDGEPLDLSDLGRPLPRNPGTHALVVEAPGRARIERSVVLTAGRGDEQVDLSPPPLAARSVAPAVVAFSLGAAGLVAGTTGAILLLHAPASRVTALRVTEVAGFAAGGAGVGAGVVLIVIRPGAAIPRATALHVAASSPFHGGAESGPTTPAPAEPWRVQVGAGPGFLSLAGTF